MILIVENPHFCYTGEISPNTSMGYEPFVALVKRTPELGVVMCQNLIASAEKLGPERRATVAASIGRMQSRKAGILQEGHAVIDGAVRGIKKAGRSAEEQSEHNNADSILS